MPKILVLSSNKQFCKSIVRFLRSHTELAQSDVCFLFATDINSDIFDDEIVGYFSRISSSISELGKNHKSTDRIVITNFCDNRLDTLDSIDPLSRSHGWSSLIAMLIISFPDVHWVFHSPHFFSDTSVTEDPHFFNSKSALEKILSLHLSGYDGLFDPTRLRSKILRNVNSPPDSSERSPIPVPIRLDRAASIDEESSYSYFNAYSAYRFGYVAWNVSSWHYMRSTLGSPSYHKRLDVSSPDLLLEDLYLKFPDRPPSISLSEISSRDEQFKLLKNSTKRFLITVGHERDTTNASTHHQNRAYLRKWLAERASSETSPRAKIVRKPLGGIFDLWKSIGEWNWGFLDSTGQPSLAEAFDWPPDPIRDIDRGHSAPGRLLLIADKLTQRSRMILEEARSPPEAFLAATLALNAKELLANRTPTTALEALTLQHRAEVVAESLFQGIEFNLDLENRFADIQREVKAISRWFSGRRRRRVMLNARLSIIEELAREFSELDQFEEERKCRAEARRLYFDFWTYQHPLRIPLRPVLRYISLSLKSLPIFLGLVLIWIFVFGVSWDLLEPTVNVGTAVPEMRYRSFLDALTSSTIYFFTLTPPGSYWDDADRQVIWNLVLILQSIISLSHLGLLVSHIYLVISRR